MAIDQKQLDGLVYRTAKRKEAADGSSRRSTYIPVERPLKTNDILSAAEHDGFTTIVTGDGRKYDIPPAGKVGRKEKAPQDATGASAGEGG